MFHSQVSHFSQIGVSVQEAEQNERYTVKHIPFGKQMVIEYKNETDAEMYVVLDEEKRLVGADIYMASMQLI